ncbi:MAG: DUF1127 domain-containing protein [Pseudomonadota bacterium]
MDWMTRLWSRFEKYRAHRRAIAELEAYDDWMLADIGINRGEIEDFVHGRLNRHPQRSAEVIAFALHRKEATPRAAA